MDYIERIRALREDRDITQKTIADILGTSQTMYARYERGANEMPIRHIITLCEFYNVSADYILGFTNDFKPKPQKWKPFLKVKIRKGFLILINLFINVFKEGANPLPTIKSQNFYV